MAGVGSRRQCDRLIAEGRVEVNGELAKIAGLGVHADVDTVRVDGRVVMWPHARVILILNKPRGMLVTLKDQRGRPTVASILKEIPERVFPIGRLDKESEGLLLLTNDGDLAYRVAHPKFGLPRTYRVTVAGRFREEDLGKLRAGVLLKEGMARPASTKIIRSAAARSEVEIVLTRGWKREIRRMLARLGFQVESLIRFGLGNLQLGGLGPGEWRLLDPKETSDLRAAVGLKEEKPSEACGTVEHGYGTGPSVAGRQGTSGAIDGTEES